MEEDLSTACSTHGRDEKRILNSVLKHERKRTLARPRSRWKYNPEINFEETQTSAQRVTAMEVKAHMDPCFILISGCLIEEI
jgi:hypothetical protein